MLFEVVHYYFAIVSNSVSRFDSQCFKVEIKSVLIIYYRESSVLFCKQFIRVIEKSKFLVNMCDRVFQTNFEKNVLPYGKIQRVCALVLPRGHIREKGRPASLLHRRMAPGLPHQKEEPRQRRADRGPRNWMGRCGVVCGGNGRSRMASGEALASQVGVSQQF